MRLSKIIYRPEFVNISLCDGDRKTSNYLKRHNSSSLLSFWQDIPLREPGSNLVNTVIEISYGCFGKFQMNKNKQYHPIEIDTRTINGKVVDRFYQQPLLFNYGYIPQTWENGLKPTSVDSSLKGDNDPIDVVEISGSSLEPFRPFQSVVLGAIALIDQDELDWKILVINKEDSEDLGIRNLNDAIAKKSCLIDYIMNWFRYSKTHEGKKENRYLFDSKALNEEKALEVIQEGHKSYLDLLKNNEYADLGRKFCIEVESKKFSN